MVIPVMPERQPAPDWRERMGAYQLSKKIGAECYVEGGTIWVYPPDGVLFEKQDPFEGDHVCDTWADALQKLRQYEAMLQTRQQEKEAARRLGVNKSTLGVNFCVYITLFCKQICVHYGKR